MRCAVSIACLGLLLATPAGARPLLRNYLAFAIGAHVLTGDVSGPVIAGRGEGVGELGIGYQLSERWLIEGTYGFSGRWQRDRYLALDPFAAPPAEHLRVWRVTTNALSMRVRYARSGMRSEYFKPELSAGLGFTQVTRLLRNYPGVPPFDTSQMLPTAEVGVAGLFVFSNTFMGWIGTRYRMTTRSDIADATDHLDGVSILLGFRVFLPSPRDVEEPDPVPEQPRSDPDADPEP
jgi:hypothetical protein